MSANISKVNDMNRRSFIAKAVGVISALSFGKISLASASTRRLDNFSSSKDIRFISYDKLTLSYNDPLNSSHVIINTGKIRFLHKDTLAEDFKNLNDGIGSFVPLYEGYQRVYFGFNITAYGNIIEYKIKDVTYFARFY